MTFTFLIIIALIGAAALGGLFIWSKQQQALDQLHRSKAHVDEALKTSKENIQSLEAAAKAEQLKIENLQQQNQTIENEVISLQSDLRVLEGEVNVLARENETLKQDNKLLSEDSNSQQHINEIEVMQEMPEMEEEISETSEGMTDLSQRIENAKRLVNAFKKGVEENTGTRSTEGA